MSIQSAVGNLTQKVDELTAAVNVPANDITSKVSTIQSHEATATNQKTITQGYATTAATHASDAATHLATVKAAATYTDVPAVSTSVAEDNQDAYRVIIYDTSEDSDGGAWRKRTQHTSWYNETLNTATRGARQDFPCVAIIVAKRNALYIYDGDDPATPLWMSVVAAEAPTWNRAFFTQSGSNIDITDVAARDGKICFVTDYNNIGAHQRIGLHVIDLVGDVLTRHPAVHSASSTSFNGGTGLTVAQRGTSVDFPRWMPVNIYQGECIAVAMTVLKDAPTDPTTGLPVPTIGVGQKGALTILQHDGTVTYDTTLQWNSWAQSVVFSGDGERVFTTSGGNHILDGPTRTGQVNGAWAGQYGPTGKLSFTPGTYAQTAAPTQNAAYHWDKDTYVYPHSRGLTRYHAADATDFQEVMVSRILRPDGYNVTRSTITGWHLYDTRRSYGGDNVTGSIVEGSEIVSNGSFATDISGVTNVTGYNISHNATNSSLVIENVSATPAWYNGPYITLTTTPGEIYKLTFKFLSVSTPNIQLGFRISTSPSAAVATIYSGTVTGTNTITRYFSAPTATTYLVMAPWTGTVGTSVEVTDISVKAGAIPSDSIQNDKLLAVTGTITKSPVATGAELQAISGIRAPNWLIDHETNDIQFGTGDFCMMGWVYADVWPPNAEPLFFYRGDSWYGTGENIWTAVSLGSPQFNVGRSGSTIFLTATNKLANAEWSHLTFMRRNGVNYIYVNGEKWGEIANTRNVDNANASLHLGTWDNGTGTPASGWATAKYALCRIASIAPTEDQIQKIVRDERPLFEENAQFTYGAGQLLLNVGSTDKKTGLTHVGYTDGHTVYDGFRRVSFDSQPVTSFIAANNEVVVKK